MVVNMGESVLEEKSSFKMLGLSLSSKLDWGYYTASIAKTASKKLKHWVTVWNFFGLRFLIFINLPYHIALGRGLICYSNGLHDLSFTIARCYKDVYVQFLFFPHSFLPEYAFLVQWSNKINNH